jgi:hypothetical protein
VSARATPITLFLIGGVVGVLVVRGFFLDPLEEIAWRIFWESLGRGGFDLEVVLQSRTFAKSLTGFAVGGLVMASIGMLHAREATAKGEP